VGRDLIPISNAVLKAKPGFDSAGYLMKGERKLTPSASAGFASHSPRGESALDAEERYQSSLQHAVDRESWHDCLLYRPQPATLSGKLPALPHGLLRRIDWLPRPITDQLCAKRDT
jgi:hypothetical protein